MEKPKVVGIGSISYPEGRIDKISIEIQGDLQGPMMSLFEELGFSKVDVLSLDLSYSPSEDYYLFLYTPNIKAHIFIDGESVKLVFDSKIDKEKLINTIKNHFQIF